jgi:hypothetical protein
VTVVPSTASSMYDLAVDFLNAVVSAMATTDEGIVGLTSYVTLGEPALASDCDQAIVQIAGLGEGATSPTTPPEVTGMRHSRGRLNLVGLAAYALRCSPITEGNSQVPMLPSFASLQQTAKIGYEDGWAIWNWITRAIDKGTLFDGPCSVVHFGGGIPFTPEAGLGGWLFRIRVELQGYDPT